MMKVKLLNPEERPVIGSQIWARSSQGPPQIGTLIKWESYDKFIWVVWHDTEIKNCVEYTDSDSHEFTAAYAELCELE